MKHFQSATPIPRTLIRLLRCAAAALTVIATAACSAPASVTAPSSPSTATAQTDDASEGRVAMFLPSDGFTLSQSTPQNTWKQLAADAKSQLKSAGFSDSDITVKTADDVSSQVQQVSDYLASLGVTGPGEASSSASASGAASASSSEADTSATVASSTVIIIASATQQLEDSKLYSDYVISDDTDAAASTGSTALQTDTARPSASQSSTEESSTTESAAADGSAESGDSDSADGNAGLAQVLDLAHRSGVTVINLGTPISGFDADVQGELSSPRLIGRLQALGIVNKLHLASTVENQPQAVEVLIPYKDASFAQQAFEGVWEILGAFFRSGRVYSPSGTLDAASSSESWQSVAYPASSPDDSQKELESRLDASQHNVSHMEVDAVLCLNDAAASGAIAALKSKGYTGTSATIDPDVSISGLVDNLRGGKDITKQQVPAPSASSGQDGQSSGAQPDIASLTAQQNVLRDTRDSTAWPLVTGYGTYKSQLSQIVGGVQWFTGLEDRQGYAKDLAAIAKAIAQGSSLQDVTAQVSSLSAADDSADGSAFVLQRTLLAITADNIKSSLIDRGYISAADAGL